MIDWTDRHCRYFHRLIAPKTRLYSEMITTRALLHGRNPERFLAFNPAERPLALQLGGADAAALAECARMAEARGYDEVNLNVGCPSDRVQSGRFGACLMAEPQTVAAAIGAMKRAVRLPVTVKTRIGIDDSEGYAFLESFVERVADAGCETFIIHARKAWLQGLSPKQNREIPPLDYSQVYRLKERHPALFVVINGGIASPAAALDHLRHVDGVMIGREAYQNPYSLVAFERAIFGTDGHPERSEVLDAMIDYARDQMQSGVPLQAVARPMLGLFNGMPGARRYRRTLSEAMHRPDAEPEVIAVAAAAVMAGPIRAAA